MMLRFLREKKLEAFLREHIIEELNKALNHQPLNLGVRVVMENLFSVRNVVEQEKLLKQGDVAFMDIFNTLKL